MTWQTLNPRIRQIALRELTRPQLDVWQLELAGHGTRTISLRLDLARSTARDRLTAAHRTLRKHGVRQHPNGSYYLEEAA